MFRKQRKFIFISLKRLISQQHITPHSIALGFAIGLFIGLGPTLGFQMIPAFIICSLLRANKLSGIIAVWASNPLTIVPIYTFNFSVGKMLLSRQGNMGFQDLKNLFLNPSWSHLFLVGGETLKIFSIGCFVVALITAPLSYFITKFLIIKWRGKKNRRIQKQRNRIAAKKKIRTKILTRRVNLLPEVVLKHSQQTIQRLETYLEDRKFKFKSLMAFYPSKNEIFPLDWVEKNLSRKKKILFPKVIAGTKMKAFSIKQMKDLQPGYKGILEPQGNIHHRGKVDLILVPGIAFDPQLHRIGYGIGFYDRFLTQHHDALKIGLFYDFQLVKKIDINQNDVPLDVVITPSKIYEKENNN